MCNPFCIKWSILFSCWKINWLWLLLPLVKYDLWPFPEHVSHPIAPGNWVILKSQRSVRSLQNMLIQAAMLYLTGSRPALFHSCICASERYISHSRALSVHIDATRDGNLTNISMPALTQADSMRCKSYMYLYGGCAPISSAQTSTASAVHTMWSTGRYLKV